MTAYEHIIHPFRPVYDAESRLLILGSLPSVRSRDEGFYYGHPRNRFWALMAALLDEPLPRNTEEKKLLLLSHHIALWDVISECDIRGSSDAAIANAVPVNLAPLLCSCRIDRVYCNGARAGLLYQRFQQPLTGLPAVVLPSTSPANAGYSFDKLYNSWHRILTDRLPE